MTLSAAEWKRKAVHAGMGLFALALRWLDWKWAAVLAFAALLFNLFVMPRIGRGIYRDSGRPRDPGIVAYPAMVLLSILLFRYELAAAAALWGMMAFGDPAATIAGTLVRGPKLPWNRAKRWAGLLAYAAAGALAAILLWRFVAAGRHGPPLEPASLWRALLAVTLLGAFLESLETGLDDNWIPPIPCALLLAFLLAAPIFGPAPAPVGWAVALVGNGLVAFATARLRVVTASGAVAGALIGTAILALCGWRAYAVLWAFFLLGTVATRLGLAEKQRRGTAQRERGRRGARHVLANCAVATAICVAAAITLPQTAAFLRLGTAFAAAFAAALGDTLGTEIGGLYGRRTFSPVRFRAVAAGTPGGVSVAGLAAGLAGACALGAIACAAGLVPWSRLWVVALCGLFGSICESVLTDLARSRGLRVDHEFANAFNTFVGASAALELSTWLRDGFVSFPFHLRTL